LYMNKSESYDIILHLAGEQSLPIYFGVMQFECPRHVLAVTNKTRHVADVLVPVALRSERKIDILEVDAYKVEKCVKAMKAFVEAHPDARMAFNVTGGTKPMFAAAYRVAHEFDIPAFYIETTGKRLDWLLGESGSVSLRPIIKNVDDFIQLADSKVVRDFTSEQKELIDSRAELTERCWMHRQHLSKLYGRLRDYAARPALPFELSLADHSISASLAFDGTAKVQILDQTWEFPHWPDIATYLCGCWFEDYVYLQLLPFQEQEYIHDLRLGIIVAGKSGGAVQEVFGRGILAAAVAKNMPVKRITSSNNMRAIVGKAITRKTKDFLVMKAGVIKK